MVTPFTGAMFNGAFTRSTGGTSFDESVLLEPTEIDGFPQVFRTAISESVLGSVSAPKFETEGLGFQQKFGTKTYFSINLTNINEDVRQEQGLFNEVPKVIFGHPPFYPASTRENLSYQERTMLVTLNQLVSQEWCLGLRERLTESVLHMSFPDVPSNVPSSSQRQEAIFNQLQFYAIYSHPSGFFARAEAVWFNQGNYDYSPTLPGDDFWQYNLLAGYRFRKNFGEISLGVLNLTGQDYRINPLNSYYTPIDFYNTIPRQRTLLVQVKFNF